MSTVALCSSCGERVQWYETVYGRFALCKNHDVIAADRIVIRTRAWLVTRQLLRAIAFLALCAGLAWSLWAIVSIAAIIATTP